MVSLDSTSRVMVLPVTEIKSAGCKVAIRRLRGYLRVLTKICMIAVDESLLDSSSDVLVE